MQTPDESNEIIDEPTENRHSDKKTGKKTDKTSGIVELLKYVFMVVCIMTLLKGTIAEARFIPSGSMEPNLNIQDRVLVEKVGTVFGREVQRGDILVFYPPPIELGGQDLKNDPLTVLGRLTGLPFLPYEPAFIKRTIGLPGDHIRIQHGVGVCAYLGTVRPCHGLRRPYHGIEKTAVRLNVEGAVVSRGAVVRS